MHSILKDGSYIQYGPKIIPNPNAEGGGGEGGATMETKSVTFKFMINGSDNYIDTTVFGMGNLVTDLNDDTYNFQYLLEDIKNKTTFDCPIIGEHIMLDVQSNFTYCMDNLDNYYIINTEDPIRSVSGSCTKVATSEVIITGDCEITLDMYQN